MIDIVEKGGLLAAWLHDSILRGQSFELWSQRCERCKDKVLYRRGEKLNFSWGMVIMVICGR